ncbi:XRE family transcriptional regulator [Nocardiopsis sp. NPDC049922]|uniref:XRE family transcriptional regulator n=1 Tax=Nocardiopsis sp. NPDC049922 TaxID=3155157 RepID=UPI0033C488E6
MDDRPTWARRISSEREARGWSQARAVTAMRLHSKSALPSDDSLLRSWKRWETGAAKPSAQYQSLIAAVFGTVTTSIFPVEGRRDASAELAVTGMETYDILSRLQTSDIDSSMLEALHITTDRLASEYPYMPSDQLLVEGRQWLRRVAGLQSQRLTLSQHREVLVTAGWLALLVSCLEHDMGDIRSAEATRRAALALGHEAGHPEISGWAQEIRSWMSLTRGDLRGVVAAAQEGRELSAGYGVDVQLAGQAAKAWARLGDRRQTELALEEGRKALERLPHPENLENHFVVDPTKFDFYAMDCYRRLGEDALASNLARVVIETGTDFDGTERMPMRIAEARITLGVAAAREGDLDQAIAYGDQALESGRKSIPSLLMVSRDLTEVLRNRYASEKESTEFLERLSGLRP